MAARVICVSRAIFTGAENIATAVARQLGFRYVDEEIVARAAQRRNLTAAEVGSAERRKSFLAQIARNVGEGSADLISYIANSKEPKAADDVRELIREAIVETAAEGNVVIVAHAASYALPRRKDVLRVLITGSEFARATRWLADSGGKSPREAAESIRDSDAARADYLRRFYDVKAESPQDYDICLSVDSMNEAQITDLVLRAAAAVGE